MASFGSGQPIVRLNFSKIEKIIDIPNLIRETGDTVEITERAEQHIVFLIEKTNGLIGKTNY